MKRYCCFLLGALYLVLFVALALSLYCADFKGQTLEFLTEGTASRAEDHWISALNFDYFRTFGESEFWYKLSQVLGAVSFLIPAAFAGFGLWQLWTRKSLKKVDGDLFFLAGLYGVTAGAYLLFEQVVLNYRPVLEEGEIAASFPSSHTLLVCVFCGSATVHLGMRIRSKGLRWGMFSVLVLIPALVGLGRLLAGVHWVTDVFGGILLGGALVLFHKGLVRLFAKKGSR